MEIGERLTEELSPKTMFIFKIPGFEVPVTDTVVVMWIIMAAIIIFSIAITRRLKLIPSGRQQHLAELIVSFINRLGRDNIGHEWRRFAPYLGTVALFLVFANIVSIFSILPDWEWISRVTGVPFFSGLPTVKIKPPTRDINVTAALAVMSISVTIIAGICVKGPAKWLKGFLQPMPIILPFKILDYFIRPTSLCLRLFGNILGAYIVMELLYMSLPAVLPAGMSIYFDLFDGILQAYVFVFLTSFYIAEAVE